MHICVHTHNTHARIRTHTHAYARMRTHARARVNTRVRARTSASARAHTRTHIPWSVVHMTGSSAVPTGHTNCHCNTCFFYFILKSFSFNQTHELPFARLFVVVYVYSYTRPGQRVCVCLYIYICTCINCVCVCACLSVCV